jgi:hypothetical protein
MLSQGSRLLVGWVNYAGMRHRRWLSAAFATGNFLPEKQSIKGSCLSVLEAGRLLSRRLPKTKDPPLAFSVDIFGLAPLNRLPQGICSDI